MQEDDDDDDFYDALDQFQALTYEKSNQKPAGHSHIQ